MATRVVIQLKDGSAAMLDLAPPPIRELNLGGWTSPIGQLKDWLVDKLASVAEAVWNIIRRAWDAIIRGIKAAVDGLVSGFSQVLELLRGLAERVAGAVVGALRKAWDGILSGLQAAVGWVKDALGKVWEVLQRIGAVVMDAVGAVATAFLGAIRDFLGSVAEVVWGAVKRLASAVESAFSWVAEKIRGVLLFVWDQILKLAPRSAEEVPAKLPALIGVLGMAGVSTMVALDAAGIKVVGSGISLDGVKGYLRDVFSPGLVQGVLIGAVLTSGIGPFVNRWVASTFRTWLPTPQEAYVMWRQGYISEPELAEILRQHGTPEKWLAARMDLADYTPPIAELLRVAQYTDLDLDWLEGKLEENGVAEIDTAKYKELFLQTSLRRIHTEIWSAVEAATSYGVPSEDAVIQYFAQARLRSFLQPYYLLAYSIRLNTQRIRWWLEAWEEQLYRGLIEPEDFIEHALSLGVDKSYAMARAAYQMARRGILWIPPSG